MLSPSQTTTPHVTAHHTTYIPPHHHSGGAHRLVLEVLEAVLVKSAEPLLPPRPFCPSLLQVALLADAEVQLL